MLVGQYETKLSPKRRVAIPFKLKKELGEGLIVAKWYEGCLVLVGKSLWQELSQKITSNTPFVTQGVRDTDRFILGSAYSLSPDAQGRVVLPEKLALYAKMTEDVVFIGLGNRVEIWDKHEWEKRESYVAGNAVKLMENIAKEVNK